MAAVGTQAAVELVAWFTLQANQLRLQLMQLPLAAQVLEIQTEPQQAAQVPQLALQD